MPACSANPLSVDLHHVLTHTADFWEELHGQRMFITGGTGFVGSWLLESFIWARDVLGTDSEALVLTRQPDAFRSKVPHIATHPGVRLIEGDIRTFTFPKDACAYVIHAASEVAINAAPCDDFAVLDDIILGTRRVLEYARSGGARKLLFVSSGAVYGRQPLSISHLSEEYTGGPTLSDPYSAYGEAKRVGELMCVLEGRRSCFETKIARGFAFVGPYLPIDARFAIGNFLRDALNGVAIRVTGDGTPRRSYLYAADLAIWLWTILFKGAPARPYNVGAVVDRSIAEVARIVASSVAPEVPVIVEHKPHGASIPERYVPDTHRSQEELGLREWINLQESVIRTLAWHRHIAKIRTT
jgi:dTDP-glucose 4,6-dehydratase